MTTNDIARRETTALEPLEPREGMTGTLVKLADWADELAAANTLAAQLCKTAFVPDHFRGKPEETGAAILTGAELGFSPMAALRAVFVIKGTPGMYAKAMVALLQSHGHQVWTEEHSDESVTVCGRRKGSEHVESSTWDRARVVKAKLTSNAKYQENPEQMLYARAASETCRKVAMDVLMACPYSVEELYDFEPPIRAEVIERPKLTAAALLGPATVETPPAQGDRIAAETRTVEPEASEPVALINAAQQRRLHASLNELGLGDRDAGLAEIGRITRRTLGSSKDLTKAEAETVIDNLAEQIQARAAAQPAAPGGDAWQDQP